MRYFVAFKAEIEHPLASLDLEVRNLECLKL
jgi:hypothetical protein